MFAGKVALIFGGASGIGKRTAQCFAREGAKVVIGDISVDGLTEIKEELAAACAVIKVNVTREAEVEKAVSAAVGNFGRLDIAVNCVGKSGLNRIVDLSEEEWKSDIDVTLTGTFLCMKHEGRQMIKQKMGGSIINICSLSSKLPGVGRATYSSSKAAVDMLTRIGAQEMGSHKVRVNAVSPGLTDNIGPQVVIECSGNTKAQSQAIDIVKKGGCVVMYGVSHELTPVNFSSITTKEITIKGGLASQEGAYPLPIQAVKSKQIDTGCIPIMKVGLDDIEKAFEALMNSEEVKAVVVF